MSMSALELSWETWYTTFVSMDNWPGILMNCQVKYFKEKRVMEYNRDRTIERIKKEDAAKIAELKAQGWSPK